MINNSKIFCKIFILVYILGMVLVGVSVIIIDPFFHYHMPIDGINYFLNKERYQNDGILKNFKYDAIITGTSMAENCKKSLVDDLFGVNSVKTCFMGASYREISENIYTAIENNSNLKLVIRAVDLDSIICDAYQKDSLFEYPTFLYDNNPFNDVEYLFNLTVMGYVACDLKMTFKNEESTSFDYYSSWDDEYEYGKKEVLGSYTRPNLADANNTLTDDEIQMIIDNVQINIIDLANDNPDISFYIWIPPYSICYYDIEKRRGRLNEVLDSLEIELNMLVNVDNIKVFCFMDEYDIVTDLSNYKDIAHYKGDINSIIMRAMKNEEHLITNDNIADKMEELRTFYNNYDYESIYIDN